MKINLFSVWSCDLRQKMVAGVSFKMLIPNPATWHHKAEHSLNIHLCEILNFHSVWLSLLQAYVWFFKQLITLIYPLCSNLGWDSLVGIAICYRLDGLGIDSWWGKIFCTHPYKPWGPPSLLYSGYWISFLAIRQQGLGIDYPPPSSTKIKERELYLYSSSGPSWPYRVNFTFTFALYSTYYHIFFSEKIKYWISCCLLIHTQFVKLKLLFRCIN